MASRKACRAIISLAFCIFTLQNIQDMRKVIGIGETVLDIIFKNNKPQAAVPGGSTFNSMISLGRAGIPAYFLSEIGCNRPGTLIEDFMKENGVSNEYVNVLSVKQPVSMAFLDENNDAEYSFYRDPLPVHPDFRYPEISRDDVVLFGSFYALNPAVRPQVKAFLKYAKAHDAILYYDVNFRPSHAKDLGNVLGNVEENYEYADIVRGSHQDFMTLYGNDDPDTVFADKIRPHCGSFICTRSSDPIQVLSTHYAEDRGIHIRNFEKSYPVTPVDTISTIGAGDSFNAGFIYSLIHYGITKAMLEGSGLSETQWDSLIAAAQAFSANCCTSMYNYITPDFAKTLK